MAHRFLNERAKGLQNGEDLLQILQNLPNGLFVVDHLGKINFSNMGAEKITGLTAAQVMGMACREVFNSPACETDCPLTKAPPAEQDTYTRELEIDRRDGGKIPIICSFSVLRDLDGKVTGGVGVFIDISYRKRLEDDLRNSETRYRRIFEGSKDMILIISKDGRIVDVNPAGIDLLGYDDKEELLALSTVELIYDNPRHWRVFQKQINKDGFVKDFEAGFRKKDGTRLHCLLSGNAARDRLGEITGYESIAKDITARMDAIRSFRKRHWELWLLNSVAFAMNRTQDLDEILMTALKKVLEVLSLDSGGIFLIDQEKLTFSLRVQEGLAQHNDAGRCRVEFRDGSLMSALLKEDLSLEPEPIFPPFRATLALRDSRPSRDLTCFLITAKGRAYGFLAFEVPHGKDLTTGEDFHTLGSLASFLGGAIENAILQETIRKHREELKILTARLFHSQEEERKRIARELHDEAGQALTGINFALETIEKELSGETAPVKGMIADVKKQINQTHQEMRRLSYRLHPALLTDLGLEPALDAYLTTISKHSGLAVDFKMVGFDSRVDPDTETVLYRLSQEATTNVLKHAKAKQFKLWIVRGYPKIIFLAEDDGIGFVYGELDHPGNALGLLSMRERAAMLGGSFSIRTAPGKGTRIRIEVPIREEAHDD
ncbi:MAG: PAS domain S-box protein [Deltaproteobacteria bacterium]|nr:PAS domain S-box protein [Deltaproteobacteria bacterium]